MRYFCIVNGVTDYVFKIIWVNDAFCEILDSGVTTFRHQTDEKPEHWSILKTWNSKITLVSHSKGIAKEVMSKTVESEPRLWKSRYLYSPDAEGVTALSDIFRGILTYHSRFGVILIEFSSWTTASKDYFDMWLWNRNNNETSEWIFPSYLNHRMTSPHSLKPSELLVQGMTSYMKNLHSVPSKIEKYFWQ